MWGLLQSATRRDWSVGDELSPPNYACLFWFP